MTCTYRTRFLVGLCLWLLAAPVLAREGQTHVLREGETLYSLSRRYGVSVEELQRLNAIDDIHSLRTGTELRVRLARAAASPELEVSVALAPADAAGEPGAAPGLAIPQLEAIAVSERSLAIAEDAYYGADYVGALETLGEARARLELTAPDERTLRVRVELLAGSVHVALQRSVSARRCFRRALALDPEASLDPKMTSPKVLELFRAVASGSSRD